MELNIASSAQAVASIEDLLIQIFLYIPLKPLVRLKLVSKHWNLIISDQNFTFMRNQNPNPAVGLIFSVIDRLSFPSSCVVSFDKPTHGPLFREIEFDSRWRCQTLNSCNGLLLCQSMDKFSVIDHNIRYYVCNLTTNKYFMLPKIKFGNPFWIRSLCSYYMSLAFDPSKSPHYKVVCVTYYWNWNQLEVYSSETGCWRKHGEPFSTGVDFSHGVYWNRSIHWISKTNTERSLYFNPDIDQVPQVMPTPPMVTQRNPHDTYWSCNHPYFGESCGHLHYIDDDKAVTELNVYEMRTDYSEWFLKYRVDCSLIDNRFVSIIHALVRGKKDEDSFLVLQSEERIIKYNLINKTCETILEKLDAVGMGFYPIWHDQLQYIECLSHV